MLLNCVEGRLHLVVLVAQFLNGILESRDSFGVSTNLFCQVLEFLNALLEVFDISLVYGNAFGESVDEFLVLCCLCVGSGSSAQSLVSSFADSINLSVESLEIFLKLFDLALVLFCQSLSLSSHCLSFSSIVGSGLVQILEGFSQSLGFSSCGLCFFCQDLGLISCCLSIFGDRLSILSNVFNCLQTVQSFFCICFSFVDSSFENTQLFKVALARNDVLLPLFDILNLFLKESDVDCVLCYVIFKSFLQSCEVSEFGIQVSQV